MKLPKTAVKIKGSKNHWIDINGDVYSLNNRHNQKKYLIKKAQCTIHGYKYCGINYIGKGVVSKRVHRLVAEAFIPNPNNYNIVGHKNNIKSDNRVENLYWTTTSENTKKAFDDGLAKNAKGAEDSQSIPVLMFCTKTNKLINSFGSISEASRETGIDKTTISRQARYKRPCRKEFYFRFPDDADVLENQSLIGMFDFDSDRLIQTFINSGDAHKETGIPERTICDHVQKNRKPLRKYLQVYFLKIKNS